MKILSPGKWTCISALFIASSWLAVAGNADRSLICRGVEEYAAYLIGQSGGPHLISLFVTSPNPAASIQSLDEHVAWVNNPLHSYVADGHGGLVVWAHPSPGTAAKILAVPGVAGLEVLHHDGVHRDQLWSEVLSGCYRSHRPFLWGFAADDTHSQTQIALSWYAARIPKKDEFALKNALRTGAFYISNGPKIDDIEADDQNITLHLQQESEVLWLCDGQYLTGKPADKIVIAPEPGENRCLQRDSSVKLSTLKIRSLDRQKCHFVRAVIRTSPKGVAYTQPWRFNNDGGVDNPFPKTGEWILGQTHNHTDTPPGGISKLPAYRQAYCEKGLLGSFSTDYAYWETPHQWLPADGTPQITAVEPDRCLEGQAVELTLRGQNLAKDSKVQMGTHPLEVLSGEGTSLRVALPASIPSGVHDIIVTKSNGFRGCLASGFTVQSKDACNSNWESFSVNDGVYPLATTIVCREGEVWEGSLQGVCCFRADKWEKFPNAKSRMQGAYAIAPGRDGGLWFASGNGFVLRRQDGSWSKFNVGQTKDLPSGRSNERWGRMALDHQGQLWAVNRWRGGLAMCKEGKWQRITKQDGLPSNATSSIACDSSGTIWAGFSDAGLFRLTDGQWSRVELPAPFPVKSAIVSLSPGRDGSMWAAVSRGEARGVVLFEKGRATVYGKTNSSIRSNVRHILVSKRQDVWFATDSGACCLLNNGKWQSYTTLNSGLGNNIVTGLAEDENGHIWFATATGVSRLKY